MTVDEALDRLKVLYFTTTPSTIEDAFDEAIDLLKTMPSDDDRERAAVYMEGLAEMKQEFAKTQRSPGSRSSGGSKRRRSRPR